MSETKPPCEAGAWLCPWPGLWPLLAAEGFCLDFQQLFLPVTPSVWDVNSPSGHWFFGGRSELATHSSIPVARPPPPNFDYNSTTVTACKDFWVFWRTVLSSCLLLHCFMLAFIRCVILPSLQITHKKNLFRLSLIRHQKASALCFTFSWHFSNETDFPLFFKSEWEWEKSPLLTIQNSGTGHHVVVFGTSGIKCSQVKWAVFLVYRKV